MVCSLHQVELALQWGERVFGLRHGELVLDDSSVNITHERAMSIYGSSAVLPAAPALGGAAV